MDSGPQLSISARRLAWFARLLLSLLILIVACVIDRAYGEPVAAPDFALRSLAQGNQRLSEYRGEVVVLAFWASWCGECREELRGLDAFYEQHREDGLVMLGINVDRDGVRATQFARSLGLDFPVLLDDEGAVSQLYTVEHMPRTVVIDRDGVIREVQDGLDDRAARGWQDRVTALLEE
jgi:peroxiredoxin